MNHRHAIIFAALLSATLTGGANAAADEPLRLSESAAMTQQEYEAYRARIQLQLEKKQTTENKAQQQEVAVEEAVETERGGYGQGYRARQERSERAARMNGGQGGAMNRAGRNR